MVSKSCAKQMLMTTAMPRLPSAAASRCYWLCALQQALSSDFSVLQMGMAWMGERHQLSLCLQNKSLLCSARGFVSVGGRRVLTSLRLQDPSPAGIANSLCCGYLSALVS